MSERRKIYTGLAAVFIAFFMVSSAATHVVQPATENEELQMPLYDSAQHFDGAVLRTSEFRQLSEGEDTTCPTVPDTTPKKIARRADTAMDADNVLHMVWQMPVHGNYEICYANNRADGKDGNMGIGNDWNTALRLSFTSTHSVWPDIEIDTVNDIILVTWTEKLLEDTEYYTMSLDGGETWIIPQSNPTELLLKADVFDPLGEAPDIPEELTTNKYTGYCLLQFRVPPRIEWVQQMGDMGVTFLGYIPYRGYIVAMDTSTKVNVDKLAYVRWTGIFQPAFKVAPNLLTTSGQIDLTIQIFNTPNTNNVVSQILSMEGQLVDIGSSGGYVYPLFNIDASKIDDIAMINEVFWMEFYSAPTLTNDVADQITAGNYNPINFRPILPYGTSYLNWLSSIGVNGTGVVVSVVDSGIHNGTDNPLVSGDMHPDLDNRVDNFTDYTGSAVTGDEFIHGTHVAGTVAGNASTGNFWGLGVAPNAHVLDQRIFDRSNTYTGPVSGNDWQLTSWALNNGANISTNSWGSGLNANTCLDVWGDYTVRAQTYDGLVRDADNNPANGNQSLVIVFSAGNDGHVNVSACAAQGYDGMFTWAQTPFISTINSPNSAKNVITVGASESYRTTGPGTLIRGLWNSTQGRLESYLFASEINDMAPFSSMGFTDDFRIKPDVVAPGTFIISANSSGVGNPASWAHLVPSANADYVWQSGTSMAAPRVAGAAAIFYEYYIDRTGSDPSPALVKAALINSAVDMVGPSVGAGLTPGPTIPDTPIPNRFEGWGRVNLTNLLAQGGGSQQRYTRYVDGSITPEYVSGPLALTTLQNATFQVYVNNTNEPLKITLVWSDVTGTPNANPALVNDLDLTVIDLNGVVYQGNIFTNGWSSANVALANPNWDVDADGYDEINNVENVYIQTPTPGNYTIRINASFVDPTRGPQDFALVVSAGLAYPFKYTVTAYNTGLGWSQAQTGNSTVDDNNVDKVIPGNWPTAPGGAATSYNVSINVSGVTYLPDMTSDIGIAKSPTVYAWMVGNELHAAAKIAEWEPHPFAYRVEANGTRSPEFDYKITLYQDEEYWEHKEVQYRVSKTGIMTGQTKIWVSYWGYEEIVRIVKITEDKTLGGDCVKGTLGKVGHLTATIIAANKRLKLDYYISWPVSCDWHVWIDVKRKNSTFREELGSVEGTSSVNDRDGKPKNIATLIKDNVFPRYDSISRRVYGSASVWEYGTHTNYAEVDRTLEMSTEIFDAGSANEHYTYTLYLNVSTTYNEPWKPAPFIRSSVVNVRDNVLNVRQFNWAVRNSNNDTRLNVNVTVTHNLGQTKYTDVNRDGTVECGLFYGWMGNLTGNVLKASVRIRPPKATIIQIIGPNAPNPPSVGDLVTFNGTGMDYQGYAIDAYNWTSGSFNYSFEFLNSSANFTKTAMPTTGALTRGYQLIYFQVRDSRGIWSPIATKPLLL